MGRIEYLDAIKGFAIILVVIGHVIAWNVNDLEIIVHPMSLYDIRIGQIWNIIYSFHMALFFMVSGFLVSLQGKSSISFLKKKTNRLLLPYVTTGFIILVARGHYGYWYFLSLFELCVTLLLIDFVGKLLHYRDNALKEIVVVFLFWGVLFIIHKKFSLETSVGDFGKFINYYPAFMLGYLMRKYNFIFEKLVGQKFYSGYLIAFIFLLVLHYSYLMPFLPELISKLAINISGIIIQIIGSLLVFQVFSQMPPKNIQNRLSKIGFYSMDIYLFHILFVFTIPLMEKYMINNLSFTSYTCGQIVYSSVFASFAIIMSIAMGKMIRKSNILKQLILGN